MRTVVHRGSGGTGAPCVWFVDAPGHSFDLATLASSLSAHVVQAFVDDWDRTLTPWPARAVFRGASDFGGEAELTLAALHTDCKKAEAEAGLAPRARAIAGYSLAGLFATWAWVQEPATFDTCASLSGSLWFEGWCDWLAAQLEALDWSDRLAYLTLGSKEKRAARPQMKRVEERAQRTAELLRATGCEVIYELTPGGHFDHQEMRVQAGLRALDARM